jgi:hypothetical protein
MKARQAYQWQSWPWRMTVHIAVLCTSAYTSPCQTDSWTEQCWHTNTRHTLGFQKDSSVMGENLQDKNDGEQFRTVLYSVEDAAEASGGRWLDPAVTAWRTAPSVDHTPPTHTGTHTRALGIKPMTWLQSGWVQTQTQALTSTGVHYRLCDSCMSDGNRFL